MPEPDRLLTRVANHLETLYPDAVSPSLVADVLAAFGITDPDVAPGKPEYSADEVVLITYGDSLIDRKGSPPLQVLGSFLDSRLADVISTVHLLPFTPASSDGGFSVVDYDSVSDHLGDWDDVASVAGIRSGRGFMADLILNHGSAKSDWFAQFRRGEAPGRDYYMTAEADEDLSQVVRPRTHPLLQEIATPEGTRHVWCTFSFDQIDFDFRNPAVLIEFCRIIDHYVRRGVTRLRLDAVAYVWKEPGTSSIHLTQTHELVKLLHTLLAHRAPQVLLITETNVPHDENVAYFGDSNEAHVVYNFSLVPLVLHSLLSGDAEALTRWTIETPPIPAGTAYLNFLASHDGMGVRPAEGLLSDAQIQSLVEAAQTAGGTFSPYATPLGERPYELNVSLADILARRDLSLLDRYLCAHAIMLAFAGIPAIYVHSLLSTPGDIAAVRTTGVKRNVNRSQLDVDAVVAMLDDSDQPRSRSFRALSDLIKVRRSQAAFAPDARQEALHLGSAVFGLRRESAAGDQVIYALHNVSAGPVTVDVSGLGLAAADEFVDLCTGMVVDVSSGSITLARWAPLWLTSTPGQERESQR